MTSEERTCQACGEANPAKAKFCLECGTPFALDLVDQLPQQAAGGERRHVSVLFADLSGFTSFSEQTDVEEVRAIARETADRLSEIVVRYGGTIDKIIGDCVMAVWGAPSSHEDDTERSVRAALDMQDFTKEHAERFAGMGLSIGVNTGEAIWAPVGGSYTVLGDTVNTAARLQGAAAKGEVLVGAETHSATEEAIEYEALEPITMKNKREPVAAFRPLRVTGEGRRRRTRSIPIVGRTSEQERVWELWERARTEASPYGGLLTGAAGVGKSRLVQALVDEVGPAATVLRGACLPYGEGITYWPVTEMIKQAAGILHDDDHDAVSGKLGSYLESLGSEDLDELRTMAVAIANLVGEPTTPRGTYTATEISRGELHWGLRRIVDLSSRKQPVVLLFEDLHWAEPTLVELILYLLEPRPDAPVLGIGSGRPEVADAHPSLLESRPNIRHLKLEALDEEAAKEMVRRLIGGEGDVAEATLRQLLDASGGNPLFLEEMIQTWVDTGADPEQLASFDVPSGLQSLISSRLDGLPEHERKLLGDASVIGDVFWPGALSTLTGRGDGLEAVLASLEERDLIRSHPSTTLTGEREFGFKHGLIREVAYNRIPKSDRALLHERAGNWITTIGADEFAEIIAYHLEQACKLAGEVTRSAHPAPILAATKALTRAAERSEARQGIREAARFYDRALEVLGPGYPETQTDLKLQRARAEISLGDLDRAFSDLVQVAQAAAEIGRNDLRSRALVNLADTQIALGHIAEARIHIEQAAAAAADEPDPRHKVRIGLIRAELHRSVDGSMEAAEREFREAAERAEEANDQYYLGVAEQNLGILFYNVGRLADAAAAFRRVAQVGRERGSLRDEAIATSLLAAVLYHVGPRSEAEQLAERAAQWLERLGNPHLQSQSIRLAGKLALERDDPATAQQHFVRAMEILPPHKLMVAGLNRLLAEARARQGRAIGARAAAAAAQEAAGDQEPYAQAFAAVASGCAGTAEGSESAAREGFERGLELYEQQQMATDLAEARVTYARALSRLGDAAGAKEQLGAAREAFEKIGGGASVEHVDELLQRVTEGADMFGPLG